MLIELSLANIAIIESLRLHFAPGLGVLTGETGAGKSIIVDAMTLLLGGRASTDLIRTGCEDAWVEGVFTLGPPTQAALRPLLEEQGLLDNEWVLSGTRPRRYYQLNVAGKSVLEGLTSAWRDMVAAMDSVLELGEGSDHGAD